MTLDEIKKLPPLNEDEIQQIETFDEKFDDPDCPKQTEEEIARFRPLKDVNSKLYAELHPETQKPKKTEIHMRVDTDVLEWFKKQGKGYQTKINEILRKYAFG